MRRSKTSLLKLPTALERRGKTGKVNLRKDLWALYQGQGENGQKLTGASSVTIAYTIAGHISFPSNGYTLGFLSQKQNFQSPKIALQESVAQRSHFRISSTNPKVLKPFNFSKLALEAKRKRGKWLKGDTQSLNISSNSPSPTLRLQS